MIQSSSKTTPKGTEEGADLELELELFPLRLVICSCDNRGRIGDKEKIVLFSRCSTATDILTDLFSDRLLLQGIQEKEKEAERLRTLDREGGIEREKERDRGDDGGSSSNGEGNNVDKRRNRGLSSVGEDKGVDDFNLSDVRLWNVTSSVQADQYLLAPHTALCESGVLDGNRLLLEFLVKGESDDSDTEYWPRSRLMSGEFVEKEEALGDEEGRLITVLTEKEGIPAKSIRTNNGKAGLENLGNTCYMNCSLQALLHTEPLMEYFVSQAHHKDLNVLNR